MNSILLRRPAPLLLVLAALAAPAAPVAAQNGAGDASGAPSLPPMAAPLSDAVVAGIDSLFADLDHTDTPGCAVGVVRDGTLAFADGYGSANLDHELPITPHTVFYMGSVSKQFTAAAVALAARQGHLSLDDDVRKWFPELPDHGATITVRHLIHHASGIRDYLTLQGITGSFEGTTDREILDLLARQRALNFPPGERYLYSNSGYFLLSELIERATGATLREFADRAFFGPQGMRSSHFHDEPDHVVRQRATAYAPDDDGFRMNHAWGYRQVGAGGLYSSVEDMARWEAAFEAGRIGPPGFRDALLERGVLASGDTLAYAFGLSRGRYRGVPMIGHGGSLAGFRSHVARFPDQRTSILVLCNVSNADPGGRALAVAERVLGDALAPMESVAGEGAGQAREPDAAARAEAAAERPSPPDYGPSELEAFTGLYFSPELEGHLTVRLDEGRLVLERRPGELRDLDAVGPDGFRAGGYRLRFRRDATGRVTGFVLDAGRANGIVFERVEP